MSVHNSYAEFVLGVMQAQLADCALHYPSLAKEFSRDYLRLSSALECHGIGFFLNTMPAYRKHLDRCLDERRLTYSGLTHFGSVRKGEVIPRLFRGLFKRVFESQGEMRADPDVNAIRLLRQLLGVVRKLRVACSEADTAVAVSEFVKIDSGLASSTLQWEAEHAFDSHLARTVSFCEMVVAHSEPRIPGLVTRLPQESVPEPLVEPATWSKLQRIADLISAELGSFDPYLWRPRHGPGAVSDARFGSYKYEFKTWPERLETIFPYADFAFANYAHVEIVQPYTKRWNLLSREVPARMCAVPKSLSTPRLIACEPTSLQWCQQIVRDFLYERVSRTILSGFIDFRRQDLNGSLALAASIDSSHATIDLSSASDRISKWHVERLFRRSPTLLAACAVTRSLCMTQEYDERSPSHILLRKYSTMGNATTFPVQSIFFLTIALAAYFQVHNLRVNKRNMRKAIKSQVRVFGDDIIVPKDIASVVVELLGDLGLKVNTGKTFTKGNFRESCGTDAFGGHDVTTINITDVPADSKPGSIVATVDVHKNLCERHFVKTAQFLRRTATRFPIAKAIATVKHGTGFFGWSDVEAPEHNLKTRWCKDTHRLVTRCASLTAKTRRVQPETTAGLLQYFTEKQEVVTTSVSTLGYQTSRAKAKISLSWVALHA